MLKNDDNINKDVIIICELFIKILDRLFDGKKPPEEIIVIDKFKELNILISNKFRMTKIPSVINEYKINKENYDEIAEDEYSQENNENAENHENQKNYYFHPTLFDTEESKNMKNIPNKNSDNNHNEYYRNKSTDSVRTKAGPIEVNKN